MLTARNYGGFYLLLYNLPSKKYLISFISYLISVRKVVYI
jgi:hypothetical protein